jgi:hypothetical protein
MMDLLFRSFRNNRIRSCLISDAKRRRIIPYLRAFVGDYLGRFGLQLPAYSSACVAAAAGTAAGAGCKTAAILQISAVDAHLADEWSGQLRNGPSCGEAAADINLRS